MRFLQNGADNGTDRCFVYGQSVQRYASMETFFLTESTTTQLYFMCGICNSSKVEKLHLPQPMWPSVLF